MNIESPTSIGSYLIYAMKQAGVDHVFGVPGDYILAFYNLLSKSDIKYGDSDIISEFLQ